MLHDKRQKKFPTSGQPDTSIAHRARRQFTPRHLGIAASTRHHQGHNEPVQTQRLGEDKDENHADEKLRLLSGGTHTGVTNNANSSAGSKTGQTDSHTAAKMSEADLRAVADLARRDCARGAGPG